MLSGGLASGKSKVRQLLEDQGVTTIDADTIGHQVLQRDGSAFEEAVARWPGVLEDGEINRSALAAIVFDDGEELAALESITHPHIFGIIRSQVEGIDSTVVVEIPVSDHGLGEQWRRMVADCRDGIRLERAIARGMSEEDARSRMSKQPSRQEWLASADLVVPNHGSVDELRSTVLAIVPHL